ncbi:glycosyltransferase family 4 protein [uncultured Winogradskyella sp.]|uniref:glycosyltransferase family 4 protein n=1 Tax=uncultured Winogradskyella sp. TaxID=395353 RepID=UPI00260459D5|nr:glycosyltransferase family 4 protein [uncultured Winogradskyella sp.]|tara:strand:- start:3931 stop:5079 length:1149 start_codon:yes stop_codon:yes gene_type:complete
MTKTEVILISQFPLPYAKIGSWTTMYNYLLANSNHGFDYIICPEVKDRVPNVSYKFLRNVTLADKIKNKLLDSKSKYSNYLEALNKIIVKGNKYIIQIIDNSGVVLPIDTFLKENYYRKDFYIQYYYHGFSPQFSKKRAQPFLYAIDEFWFLTNLAYKAYLDYYVDCVFKARVIHNGTDSNQFKRINSTQKSQLRDQNNINKDAVVFLWCSQNRPKKGLQMVLEAFQKVYVNNKNIQLLVVGITKELNQEGVTSIGRVPNKELHMFYQLSDVFVFPSLWKEGFGIVLAEALKCGCYCIASNQGGIPEVLNFGEYGVLVENPNFVDEWVEKMEYAISILKTQGQNPFLEKTPENIYDIENWANKIKLFLEEAKLSLNMSNNKE